MFFVALNSSSDRKSSKERKIIYTFDRITGTIERGKKRNREMNNIKLY